MLRAEALAGSSAAYGVCPSAVELPRETVETFFSHLTVSRGFMQR